jgi:hypothetical protein
MSLYSDGFFDGNWKKLVLIGIIIIIVVVGGYFLIKNIDLSGNNISAKFDNNPLVLSKNPNTILNITVKNNTEVDRENSIVMITPVEDSFVVYCPDSDTNDHKTVIINKMGAGNERTVSCDIRYSQINNMLEGTYSFDIKYTLNNLDSSKRIKLTVRR